MALMSSIIDRLSLSLGANSKGNSIKLSFTMIAVVIASIVFLGCVNERDYRQEMRDFVQDISIYAREIEPGFIVIPQNGHELLTEDGMSNGTIA